MSSYKWIEPEVFPSEVADQLRDVTRKTAESVDGFLGSIAVPATRYRQRMNEYIPTARDSQREAAGIAKTAHDLYDLLNGITPENEAHLRDSVYRQHGSGLVDYLEETKGSLEMLEFHANYAIRQQDECGAAGIKARAAARLMLVAAIASNYQFHFEENASTTWGGNFECVVRIILEHLGDVPEDLHGVLVRANKERRLSKPS